MTPENWDACKSQPHAWSKNRQMGKRARKSGKLTSQTLAKSSLFALHSLFLFLGTSSKKPLGSFFVDDWGGRRYLNGTLPECAVHRTCGTSPEAVTP